MFYFFLSILRTTNIPFIIDILYYYIHHMSKYYIILYLTLFLSSCICVAVNFNNVIAQTKDYLIFLLHVANYVQYFLHFL